MAIKTEFIVIGAAILAAGLYIKINGAQSVGYQIGSGAIDLVDGVVSGGVIGIGKAVGVPETNKTQCAIDKANGDTWAASFSCPAGDFLSYLWN